MDLSGNLLVVNFKTYDESTGDNALELLRVCDRVASESGVDIVAVPALLDLERCCRTAKEEGLNDVVIFAQHVDPSFKEGKLGNNTGRILAAKLRELGVQGSLLNHSERKLTRRAGEDMDVGEIKARVSALKAEGLKSIVCCGWEAQDLTVKEGKLIAASKPDYIAVEPPEMIGGDVSVTTKPELITGFVKAIMDVDKNIGILTGAGVKNGEHAAKAIKLGTKGVLVASGIVKPKEGAQEEALTEMAGGLK